MIKNSGCTESDLLDFSVSIQRKGVSGNNINAMFYKKDKNFSGNRFLRYIVNKSDTKPNRGGSPSKSRRLSPAISL